VPLTRRATRIDEIVKKSRELLSEFIFKFFYRLNAAHQRQGKVARILRLAKCVTL
jgi:hypothetical protein